MSKLSFDRDHNVINGALEGAEKQYHSINPFTEEKLWDAPVASAQDLDEVVEAANVAFQTWQHSTLDDRRSRMKQFASELFFKNSDWTDIISETGQPKELAEREVESACEWLTGIASIDIPEYTTYEDDNVKVTTKYFPLGVVGAIVSWNFPIFLVLGKVASSLICGNTVIVKPSPYTPYSIPKVTELAQSFFPPGVVEALGGDENLGPWMTKHPGIAKISFTGSAATGKRVMEAAASTLKRVTLELSGGNDAAIICADVDIDDVAQRVMEDVKCASQRKESLCTVPKPGTGYLSPVQNKIQFDKVRSIFEDCRAQNYKFAIGGEQDLSQTKPGFQMSPAVVVRPPDESRLVQEEPFGPIDDEENVIHRANNTDQGLGATLWYRDPAMAERISMRLDAGSVWVNRGAFPLPTALFGGCADISFCEAVEVSTQKSNWKLYL
ncbi:aldehyde dehydrogenase DhaS [Penicillium cataractarum]|uniref:aldehyde dehydrogenase (NAD(+)) n=1 Tax=Penicillium cataractarum TaxID=2100454 RepID=A0A9W9RXS3_9EURO|nr:aldehyde dehydrogenase DhaS [Penicillium cataractarum]KAJ5368151.1 aldehyde dehydrogenase DhaS [Penicillium cataractarum]